MAATQTCYYDNKRRRRGDVFTIATEKEFSARYMRKVDPATPERLTTGSAALKQQPDEILAGKQIEANPDLAKPRTDRAIDEDDDR